MMILGDEVNERDKVEQNFIFVLEQVKQTITTTGVFVWLNLREDKKKNKETRTASEQEGLKMNVQCVGHLILPTDHIAMKLVWIVMVIIRCLRIICEDLLASTTVRSKFPLIPDQVFSKIISHLMWIFIHTRR